MWVVCVYVFVLVVHESMSVCIYSLFVCVHTHMCACTSVHTNPYIRLFSCICTYHILVQYIHDSAVMSEINCPPPDSYPLSIAFAFSYNFPPFPPCTSIIRPKAIARMTSIVILLYKLQLDTDT